MCSIIFSDDLLLFLIWKILNDKKNTTDQLYFT